MTPHNSSRQDIYTRHTAERPITVKTDSSFHKEFPLARQLPQQLLVCLPGCGHLHYNNFRWVSSPPSVLPGFCDSGEVKRGEPCWAVLNGAEPALLKFPPPMIGRNRWGWVAGWANWAKTLNQGFFFLVCFNPSSQSSVVSQLTSRGTWRHLVPVWMTVTVEGRGRGGSATAGASSCGAGASESWLYTSTADGRGAMGGPVTREKQLRKGDEKNQKECDWKCITKERKPSVPTFQQRVQNLNSHTP